MAGKVIRILDRTAYDFSQVALNTTSAEIALATDLDISGAREITLLVRVHAFSITGGSGGTPKITFVTRSSAPTNEEPNQFFRDPSGSPLNSTDLTSATAPSLTRIALPTNAGAWITVLIKGTQWGTGVGTVSGTFSIDVSLKE